MSTDLRKPNIERLLTTMRGGIPDRVPNYEILIEARNVKALLGQDVGTTMAASRGSSENALYAPPMAPELFAEICNKTGMDAMTLESLWTPLKWRDGQGGLHIINDRRLNEWDDLDRAILPDWEHDFKPRRDVIRDYVRVAKQNNQGVVWCTGAFFQCCYFFLCDFNEFLVKFYTDRKFVETLFDICTDYYVKMAEIAVEEGVDVLFLADDIAFKSGTFVEPESFKELWLPRAKRILKVGKDAGLPIMFHSCGNLTNVMDSIIMELGLDVLNPIEPYSMDIYDIKKRYGDRLTLSGNIDIAGPLAFGTPGQVREEVRQHMEALKPGGRYILSTNHSVMDDIPPENFRAMLDAGMEFGKY
ncbi:MAG: uroporphyrinogen decarboxylase family protein [bacterium]